MNALLLVLLLLQANPRQVGIVTGKVTSPDGRPAVGIRVFAVPMRDPNAAGDVAVVFDSLAQTDDAGRYQLEVPVGRYYIAAGSVEAPTYFPGTTEVALARVLSITAGTTIQSIDFSRYNPASSRTSGLYALASGLLMASPVPPGTGVISGIIRQPDGKPAVGVAVAAVSANPGQVQSASLRAVTDNTGRYRIQAIPSGTYHVAAGFADSPTYYPGTADVSQAISTVTTATTAIDTLDFTLPSPTSGAVASVRGRVLAAGGIPAAGAFVNLVAPPMQPVLSLLPMRPSKEVRLAPDGSFEFTDVVPGKYTVNAGLSALASQQKQITVADQPVTGLEFSFPFAVVSGRVVSEDGTPLSDATAFKSVALSTSNNPNMIRTSIVAVRDDGSFAQVMDADLFRVYVPVLPPGYVVKSITAGATDLLKEDLRIGLEAVNVEVKVGKSSGAERVNVRGKVLDHTGAPSRALRIELCCFNSGPFERLATDIRSDGSFEFRDVPAGQHRAELQGPSPLGLRDPRVEVLPDKVTEVNLVSPPPVASSSVNLMVSVSGLPSGERSIVTFTGLSGVSSVIAVGTGASVLSLTMSNPFGDGLSAAVSNVPAGYVVKSIVANGTTDLLNGRLLLTSGGAPITISITFAPK